MAVAAIPAWTLEDLNRLPDDGNKYEVIRGELFVTPAPSRAHQLVIARLARLLDPYVQREKLGVVHQARSIVRRRGSEAEPDLFVDSGVETDWDSAPTPLLVVEVLSGSTRRRDLHQKRAYYLEDVGVGEYWMIDRKARTVRVARPIRDDVIHAETLSWRPAGASQTLDIQVRTLFG